MDKISELNRLLKTVNVEICPDNANVVQMIYTKNKSFGVYIQLPVFKRLKNVDELLNNIQLPHVGGLISDFEIEFKKELNEKATEINNILKVFDSNTYTADYVKENYGQISVKFPRALVDEFRRACKELGLSQREIIKEAMMTTIELAKCKGEE